MTQPQLRRKQLNFGFANTLVYITAIKFDLEKNKISVQLQHQFIFFLS